MHQLFKNSVALLLGTAGLFQLSNAQLTIPPSGGNKKALVGERIGLTDVTVHYDRPGVKGREGQIWGKLIYVGYADQGFGTSKAAPWRAGANENTTLEFSTAVKIEGQPLAAGKYGFFVAYDPAGSTLIFSHNSTSWGSFFYHEQEDALRVKVQPQALDKSVEWLQYSFVDQKENSATLALDWEKTRIPIHIEVDLTNTQLASFRNELRSDKGFNWQAFDQAAAWCVQHDTNLEEALLWADSATSENFGGSQLFRPLSTKAQVLDKLNRGTEAAEIMKKALPFGSELDLHQYARQLLSQKKTKEAFAVFKMNYDKHPGVYVTSMGLMRGYSALGDYKKALEFAQKALPLAPGTQAKSALETMIGTLKEGKDIN